MGYRCDPWDESHKYDKTSLLFKIHVQNPPKPEEAITTLPITPSPVLKSTTHPGSTRNIFPNRRRQHHMHRR